MDSLSSRYSWISNEILLFSDIGLSLEHHYRVHKRGVPHVAFRKNYMLLRILLPLPTTPAAEGGSPEPGCSSVGDSPDAVGASFRPSRRVFARRHLPNVNSHLGGGGDLLGFICPELGVAPLVNPGTNCIDELLIPADPPAIVHQ